MPGHARIDELRTTVGAWPKRALRDSDVRRLVRDVASGTAWAAAVAKVTDIDPAQAALFEAYVVAQAALLDPYSS